MNTTRRGFLASVAALLGYGAAGKSEPARQPTVGGLPRKGDPCPGPDVTLIGGPMDGDRFRMTTDARWLTLPMDVVPMDVGDGRWRFAAYERSANDPSQLVYRGIK